MIPLAPASIALLTCWTVGTRTSDTPPASRSARTWDGVVSSQSSRTKSYPTWARALILAMMELEDLPDVVTREVGRDPKQGVLVGMGQRVPEAGGMSARVGVEAVEHCYFVGLVGRLVRYGEQTERGCSSCLCTLLVQLSELAMWSDIDEIEVMGSSVTSRLRVHTSWILEAW